MIADQFPAPKIAFDDVDTNGSGFISYDEFATFLKAKHPGNPKLAESQTTQLWNKYCNAVNDGVGNADTIYSANYDKVKSTLHYLNCYFFTIWCSREVNLRPG